MREQVEERLRELASRAGMSGVSPKAVVVAALVLACAVTVAAVRWLPGPAAGGALVPAAAGGAARAAASAESTAPAPRAPSAETSETGLWVHIIGAVRHPGLYQLHGGSRVQDAVQAAGGLLGVAAPEAVNLARKVADGEQIAIPTEAEARRGVQPGVSAGGGGSSGAAASAATGGPVNLNTATADQLDALPGIGPATALKIIADREANGPFASADDLGRVAGIGPKKLEQLKDLICVQ